MRLTAACEPGNPDVPNEDWLGFSGRVVVVLDGVTIPATIERACTHGTPWYVRQLGAALLEDAERTDDPLADILGRAITAVAALHRDTCDPSSLGAPSAAVAMLRLSASRAEYLALADVSIVLDARGAITAVTDNRVAASVEGVDRAGPDAARLIAESRAAWRNQPGGYWVAAADPAAAQNAVTGSVGGVCRAAVMTDGAAAAHDMLGLPWEFVLGLDAADVIGRTRTAERADASRERWPRWKLSDDAAIVLLSP